MLGSLVVSLSANTALFQSDLGRAAQVAESEMQRINAAVFTVKTAFAALGGAALFHQAFEGIKERIKGAIDSMAQLDDAAERTGASVESLSGLLNTLKPSGASLDTITGMAEKMVKAMQGADKETGKAAEAFAALGISTKDAEGNLRPVDEVLRDVANALNTYADGSNKTAIAQALLGKAGAEYLPLLKDLANDTQMASTVTAEQAAQAEQLQKALGRLAVATDALWTSLANKLVPTLADVATKFEAARRTGKGFFDSIQLATLPDSKVAVEVDRQVAALAKLRGSLNAIDKNGELFPGDRAGVEESIKRREAILDVLLKQYRDLNLVQQQYSQTDKQFLLGSGYGPKPDAPKLSADTEKTASDGERLLRSMDQRLATAMKLTEVQKLEYEVALGLVNLTPGELARARIKAQQLDSVTELNDAMRQEQDLQRTIDEAEKRNLATVEREAEAAQKLAERWTEVADPALKYQRQLEEIQRLHSAGLLSDAAATQAAGKTLAKQFEELNVMKALEETDVVGKKLNMTLTSAFEDAALSAKSFGDIARGVLQDVMRMFIRTQITTPLFNGLSSWFSGLGGPTYNTGGLTPGTVWSGMDAADNVLAAAKSASGVTIHQNVEQIGSNVSRSDLQSAMLAAKSSAVAEVMRQFMRNGALARAM